MTVKTGSAWAGLFVTLDATGALAAGTPSGVLYVDGVSNGATVTITGSNPYKWSVTLPALTAGQRVDMYITATISTIATAGIVASEQADTALTSEVKAETALILADTGTDGVVLAATQGAITWARQKIVANAANEGALDITNNDATGLGINVLSYKDGIRSYSFTSNGIGAYGGNGGSGAGIKVKSDAGDGVTILGATNGVSITGTTKNVSGFDTEIATAAALATVDGIVDSILADTGTDGVKLADDAITAAVIATDAIDADAIKADAITEIQNGLATPTNITAGTITTVTNLTNLPAMPNDWLTAAGVKADAVTKIATGVWASATRTLSSFGTLVSDIWGAATRTLSAFGFTVATNSDANVTAIKAKTDNLPASPAAVGSAMTLTVGERTAIANEVESQIIDDTDAEKVLKAITDKIASVNPSLDDLTLAGIASAVRTELTTELARIDAAISTRLATAGYTAPANADISTIKSKTNNLPASPAASGEYTSALSAIQADLDNPNQYKADVSGLATTTHLQEVEDKVDAIPASITAEDVMTSIVEGAITLRDSLKLVNAMNAGKVTGGKTSQIVFRDLADTLDRIIMTVDASGNRTTVTRDVS